MDMGETPIYAAGVVSDNGRYTVDLNDVLLTNGSNGLEAGHVVQAEMQGQVYKTVVQPYVPQDRFRLFLPVVAKQSLP